MKRFICRHNPKYYENAAWRIMDEVLVHIPQNNVVLALVFQDIKALIRSGPGVYYVADNLPSNVKVVCSDTQVYFYKYRVFTKKNRIQNFIIPRNPLF